MADKMIRLTSERRREVIITAISSIVTEEDKIYTLTHDSVAEACEIPTSRHTVKHYFRTKQALYDEALKLFFGN